MNLDKLKQKEVAALLSVEDRTIRNYEKEEDPIPSHSDGKVKYYLWMEVLAWRDRRRHASLLAQVGGREEVAVVEKRERALLLRAQREIAEMQAAEKRKETVSIQDAQKMVADIITPARLTLRALPARLRPAIGNEAADRLKVEIDKLLRSLGGAVELEETA